MFYRDFHGKQLSALGFGAMRLPLNEDKTINEAATAEMVDLAMANGVNYFDTAFPYHGGMSEIVLGKALAKYPRDSYYLATKFPGHQIADSYDPAAVFEEQLKKCGVEYFDFYLLHNVYEKSAEVYTDEKWNIIPYFLEQKRLGRIRHLGFSTHARPDALKAFLDKVGDDMEFCQIQLNYLDWTLQEAAEKCAILNERNIPIWVMEPVRGGRLAQLTDAQMAKLDAICPGRSAAEWAFRWIQSIPGVTVTLSGMSNAEQMRQNIATFDAPSALSDAENAALAELAESMKNSIPCTGCRYCCDGCPMSLDIPALISALNDIRFGLEGSLTAAMQLEAMPANKQPSCCIGCGCCEAVCPQNISIPAALRELASLKDQLPSWKKISAQRAAEAKQLREARK